MTGAEIKKKLDTVLAKCHGMKALPLAKIKQLMDSPSIPDGEKLYYRLEHTYRINGGKEPALIILEKMHQEWQCEFTYEAAKIGIATSP